jgi:2-succinyl-5-enolpyruvyl-6-hydroxy-3-cyclohexene-1-carboxylate synthase
VPPSPATGCSAEANLRAALTLLQTLQDCGLHRLVLCPGSRSAPLAVAAGLLAQRGLDLLTAVDERSAAFLAVGLGRGDGRPAAVVTTSGTAVANLLPAVVEADSGAVPLLLLTADRPARLKHCGANQTVNQEDFLAPCCRLFLAGDPAGLAAMPADALQRLGRAAWSACLGAPRGPVHLNLPLEEPLHADGAALEAAVAQLLAVPLSTAPVGSPAPEPTAAAPDGLDPEQPGVVVAGPWRGTAAELAPFAEALIRWQRRSGWPVLADGLSGLRGWPGLALIHSYDLLLAEGHALPPASQVLRLGPMPASRRLQQWLATAGGPSLLISQNDPRRLDAGVAAGAHWPAGLAAWLDALPPQRLEGEPNPASLALAQRWSHLDHRAQQQLDQELAPADPREPAIARVLSRALPEGLPLMLASSSPVRDWESFAAADGPQRPLFGFRGASGIDGTLSLAAGLAISSGRLVLLTGDLALLHDANGWLWRQQLQAHGARLCVLVVDNGGGGIFEQLPIRVAAEPEPLDFERLFAMPQAIAHPALAAGYGVPSRPVPDLTALGPALAWGLEQPLALLELRSDRRADADWRRELRRRMTSLSALP